MKFKFRLERVLGHREEIERAALINMAAVQAERDRELRKLAALLENSQSLKKGYRSFKGKGAKMDELRRLHERIDAVKADISSQRELLKEWERKLAEAREKWTEARKAKKVLQTLKEKEFTAFVKKVEKAETALLDEVALRPFTTGAQGSN